MYAETDEMIITRHTLLDLNEQISKGFTTHKDDQSVRKTHLFDGRYENIYLKPEHIPALALLINEAVSLAEEILGTTGLRAGYWFNAMPPGAITTLHTHDDDDELLSGVYYVEVPKNSGSLKIHNNQGTVAEIQPESGKYVFFEPNTPHEVSSNDSGDLRLSIGMNFGKVIPEQDMS